MPQVKSLQSLRFIFILMIFMSHFSLNKIPFDYGGNCGVSFFFMLSGFVLALSKGSKVQSQTFNHRRFLGHQLLKIYPLHILCLIIWLGFNFKRLTVHDYLAMPFNLTLTQSWVPNIDFYFWGNGLSWFLCDTFFMYLLFPMLYKAINKPTNRQLSFYIAGILASYIACIIVVPDNLTNWFFYVFPLTRMLDFCLGMMSYRFFKSYQMEKRLKKMSEKARNIIEISMVGIVICVAFLFPVLPESLNSALLFWFFMPHLIIVFAASDKHGGIVTKLLQWPPLQYLGNLTFEFYLIHHMVIGVLLHRIADDGTALHYWSMLALCLSASLVAAWALHRWFTQPIYHRLKKT